ncbi:c-type cytochrome [Limibacter armeniacum]|uniref:c-type cytochrome n=1 Tax=Limibacter armeniacum TaxID=466084 RepID=UPI002FE51AFA
MDNFNLKSLVTLTRLVVVLATLLLIIASGFSYLLLREGKDQPLFSIQFTSTGSQEVLPATVPVDYYQEKNPEELSSGMENEYIKYGFDLISNTSHYIGPQVENPTMRFAGNNLACKNCHLGAGQKMYAAPYVGITGRFPQYRGRENTIGTLEERINGCMERSMNGKKLPLDGKEMKAMIAYMTWLSKEVPVGEVLKGKGFVNIEIPDRKVDLENGKMLYAQKCAVCHGKNGQGQALEGGGYTYPPLWGKDSYNHGAGMHRVLTAARFIKGNMPLGATYENPILTDEEAYDVAAFINSHSRPLKEGTEKDFPDISRKPVDSPYPPFADSFPAEQHKYGPFKPLIEFKKTLKHL